MTSRAVPTRRISFEAALADMPKYFAKDGDIIQSHLAAALSSVFPDGEDFFVRSVRHYRDRITDPELKQQVAGFIGQESVHGREHRALNDRFDELGYPVKEAERFTKKLLELRSRYAPPSANLAATAALEHFTATIAELLLSSEELREHFGHEGVRDVFVWHALEESEHKAVAFDVYQRCVGKERLRTFTMNAITVGFIGGMALQVAISILRDKDARNVRKLRASWKRFKKSPLVTKEMWRQLREYNRPGFHPDDRDTTELLELWKAELFGAEGRLNPLLATSAAKVAA